MDDSLVVAGGVPRASKASQVSILDLDNHRWLLLPSLEVPRSRPSLIQFKGRLVCVGGLVNNQRVSTVEVLDLNV